MHASPRTPEPSRDGAASTRSRALLVTLAVASLLVVARSAIYWYYEQSFFDSDQAIIGLMAKHLAEGRAFPLFYYGQTYMLGVDAWVAAPVFALFGATVRSLHGALILMNVAAAALLAVGLIRDVGLRALFATVALVYFALAPPLTTASLIEAGANIGPFLYVPLLWFLRGRPLWFGLVLGVGVLNREFTIYAVPALLAGDLVSRAMFRRERVRFWLIAAVATFATWQGIQGLKPYSDMMGPGTRGQLIAGDPGSQMGNIRDRVAIVPSELPGRVRTMLWEHLPGLWGLRRLPDAIASQGRRWMFWPVAGALALAFSRSVWLRCRAARAHAPVRDGFAWYLSGVGALAVVAYVLTRPADGVVHRYLLLTLLLPIGLTALHLAHETRRWLSALTVAVAVLWAAASGVDHWQQVTRYWGGREPNETRDLARALEARQIRVAEANYWLAYKVTFLTKERIKVASTDVVRIDEYQRLARAAGSHLVLIADRPCTGGTPVSLWFLCPE
jgi:hypothetical protein